ncbi:Periplasmic beta-glucosidase precursor [compost metagenome]
MNSEGLLKVTVSVTNGGSRAGEEVVQLYVRDWSGDVIRPLKELKDFAKIKLAAGETRELVFELTEEQLRYTHSDLSFSSDNGKFTVFVGPNSRDVQSIDFVLDKQKVPQVV